MQRGSGIAIHRIEPPVTTSEDELAFGFMTWRENGTLVRVDGINSEDFIEARLVGSELMEFVSV